MMTRTLARRVSLAASLVVSTVAVNGVSAQATAAATSSAKASSNFVGRWEGNLFIQAMQIPIVITLDSAMSGWSGTLLVAMMNPSPIIMALVVVKQDTVSMTMPAEGMGAFFQGLLSADKKTVNGMLAVNGDNSGTFQVSKATVPPTTEPKPGIKHD